MIFYYYKRMSSKEKSNSATENISEALRRYGHIYTMVVLVIIALFTRIRNRDNLITESGELALLGNDSWYHYRAIQYTIDNFPFLIGIDPKSGYPIGADVGTFGTLYDQIIATIALVIGLGNPSSELVRQIMAYSSPVFFVLILGVVYYLTKYMTGSKWTGVAAAGILTFIPGTLFQRSVIGFAQHHVLEVLLLLTTIYFTIRALDKAQEDVITLEVIQLREIEVLKPWLKYVGLASLSLLAYYLTWPPAMMYFGLLAAGAGVYTFISYDSDKLSEPALLTFFSLLVASTVFVLVQIPTMETSVSNPSIIHVGVVLTSLVGTGVFILLNKYADENNWSQKKFHGSLFGLGFISVISLAIIQPSVFSTIFENILRLLGFPFGIGGEDIQTIAEEQSTTFIDLSFSQYGFLLATAIAGMVMVALGKITNIRQKSASNIFLVVLGVFFVIISIRTVRFNYYLAPFVAIFSVLTIKQLIEFVEIPRDLDNIEGYQVIALLLVITVIIPILFLPVSGTVFSDNTGNVNIDSYQEWEEPLLWLEDSTETDNIPNDKSVSSQPYDYGEDTYGVMSWWDYGHWITVTGDRAPVANPFQQHAEESSQFLLEDNPEEAEQVMTDMDENAEAKYIAIDWQMVSPFSKLTAIPEFNKDVNSEDLINPYYISDGSGANVAFFERNQRYYESMMVRLYYGHGGQMEPGPYTIDYSVDEIGGNVQQSQEQEEIQQSQQTIRSIIPQQNPVKVHDSVEEARQYAQENDDVTFNGFGTNPQENVEALENYRLVKSSPESAFQNGAIGAEIGQVLESSSDDIELTEFDENPSSVKLFEKVEGAEITGDGADANERISITVQMFDPDTGLSFEYKQDTQADSNGEFSATVPYSTTGYEDADYPPEVQSQGSYIIEGHTSEKSQSVDIEENDVVTNDTSPVHITLDEEEEIDMDDALDGIEIE